MLSYLAVIVCVILAEMFVPAGALIMVAGLIGGAVVMELMDRSSSRARAS